MSKLMDFFGRLACFILGHKLTCYDPTTVCRTGYLYYCPRCRREYHPELERWTKYHNG